MRFSVAMPEDLLVRFDQLVADTQVTSTEEMEALLLELQQVVAEEVPLLTIAYADTLQVCNTSLYDGWKAGKGTNVVNVYSFLGEETA